MVTKLIGRLIHRKDSAHRARISVSGNGVAHVRASDLLRVGTVRNRIIQEQPVSQGNDKTVDSAV